jgi:geranylgeranyl reductase
MLSSTQSHTPLSEFEAVVIGGGPAGATAAHTLAQRGRSVLLLDKGGRIKPCGGAIPPRLIRDFAIPESQIVARARSARMVSPSGVSVDMPIDNGSVGMVDRGPFDEWLRERAAAAGATRREGSFVAMERDPDGVAVVLYRPRGAARDSVPERVRARTVIGADGARSRVAELCVPGAGVNPCVFAYHEIVESPPEAAHGDAFDPARCDIHYNGRLSPDFYAWVFPHGATTSIGVGSAQKGFDLKGAVSALRAETGLSDVSTQRCEGAPIPLKPLKKWDNGRDVMLAGDAAGCVAPASGEGIYYAMLGGEVAAEACDEVLSTGDVKAFARARKRYLKVHGKVFFILGLMQHFWYRNDKRRERFVNICKDKDVQRLTWDAYMNKTLGKPDPAAHMRIFFKDMAHLIGIVKVSRT